MLTVLNTTAVHIADSCNSTISERVFTQACPGTSVRVRMRAFLCMYGSHRSPVVTEGQTRDLRVATPFALLRRLLGGCRLY